MENKTFIFASAWIEPLRKLTPEQRWNVVESIIEYTLNRSISRSLSMVEDMAFTFIRGDLDRMQSKYNAVCDKRRQAANSRWKGKATSSEANDTQECKSIPSIAEHYEENTDTNQDTEPEPEPKPKRKSSPSSGIRARKSAGKREVFDESQLLRRFFDSSNQIQLEALAMKHHLPISELKAMAEEITIQWALTDKTHDTYEDASLHLIYALAEKAGREGRKRLQDIAQGRKNSSDAKGVLGIDEYLDEQGRRTYNGSVFIPHDAPPRPGTAFWWNETTLSWDDNI